MLQTMRQRIQGPITWLIVILMALAFMGWGLSDYFAVGGPKVAAKVNGEKISWQAVDTFYHRVQQQAGEGADLATLKNQVRQFLAERMAVLADVKRLGFRVADQQIVDALLQVTAFQEDGKFSKKRYEDALKSVGFTDAGYRDELVQEILLAQFQHSLVQTDFGLPYELETLVGLATQTRDIGYFSFVPKDYQAGILPAASDIQAYYEAHKANYLMPEQVSLEYIKLSLDDLAKEIAVDEETLKSYYEQHKESFHVPERVHARHILISLPPKTNEDFDAKAKAQGEEILAKLKAGEDFATIAKKHSADRGSAEQGGDLGWFTRHQMVAEFDKAVFDLKEPKALSGLVRTQFGYHIIQLIEHRDAETRPFNEVKLAVKEQLQKEKALNAFESKTNAMEKYAFEESKTLASLAEKVGLPIKSTEFFSRQGGDMLSSDPKIIQAAFSDRVLKQGLNSEPVILPDHVVVVLRLKQHKPALQQPLNEVEAQVKQALIAERASKLASEKAESILAKLQAGEKPETLAKAENLTLVMKKNVGRQASDLEKPILTAAFNAPRPHDDASTKLSKPSFTSLQLPSGERIVLMVNHVQDGKWETLDKPSQDAYTRSLAEVISQLEFALYAAGILHTTKFEYPPIPAS